MLFASLSFYISAILQHQIDESPDNSVSVFWQIPQILTISIAEILVSVTGLEFAYAQAPPSLKSMLTALYLLTTSIYAVSSRFALATRASNLHLKSIAVHL